MVDFEEAYSWLRLDGIQESYCSPYTKQLVRQMLVAIDGNQRELAWDLLERLNALRRDLPDATEVAEIMTECGRAAYKLGSHKTAAKYLRDAIERYNWHKHQAAVVQWMLGCLLWRSPGEHIEAIRLWQQSLDRVDALCREESSSQAATRYRANWVAMDRSLFQAIAQDGMGFKAAAQQPPAGAASAQQPPAGAASAQPPPAGAAHAQPPPAVTWDLLELYPVSEEIPAGGFGPTGVDPKPIDYVEVEQLLISGNPHYITSLRVGHLVKLNFSFRYTVLKVVGDSMNLENIQDGDYVLLKIQEIPDENDIVAAEIVGEDSSATLKRFNSQKNKIVLSPHSTNPIHKPREFTVLNRSIYIRGIAVAVLKPV